MGVRGNYAVSRDAQINHRLEECVEVMRQRLIRLALSTSVVLVYTCCFERRKDILLVVTIFAFCMQLGDPYGHPTQH
eukprot:scaffold27997_cov83-Skeletonema_dohrnii-CCMP3373.AAC.1